jgi:hypothetical protein
MLLSRSDLVPGLVHLRQRFAPSGPSVLPWKIAPAHRIADGSWGPQLFHYPVKLALDFVQSAEDQGEVVVGGHGSTRKRPHPQAGGLSEDGALVGRVIRGGDSYITSRLVALIPSEDLFVHARDLLIEAMAPLGPVLASSTF